MTEVQKAVYRLTESIPEGKVTTYGKIAKFLGLKTPRQVGWILHKNPDSSQTPCHRVVFSDGSLSSGYAFGGKEIQKDKLLQEGVKFKEDKVDLSESLFEFKL